MANISRINGFRPVKHITGAAFNDQSNIYAVASSDATPLFVGDPVKLATGADAKGVNFVTRATTGSGIVGVVVGIINPKQDPVSGSMTAGSIVLDTPVYRAASTAQYVLVADSPDLVFEVEATGASAAAYNLVVGNIGKNADLYAATGSTSTGVSGCALDMSTLATTATLQWRVLSIANRPDNEYGGNYTKVLVTPNNHQLKGGTGVAGV